MVDKNLKKSNGPSKSFMTVGPTLHYSHANVRRCWALAVVVFVATCLFWSKVLTGTALALSLADIINSDSWRLSRFIISPLSIYEYPWQILVLGLLMGILAVGPVIVSQLLSFRYSVPMILAVVFISKLPLFGVFLLVSCAAVASRPLRFRSRFIAIALCMAPQLIYWAFFGGAQNIEPIRWGVSFAPWLCAWLVTLAIAGAAIGIGHFTRYRPGLVWAINAVVLAAAVWTFQREISFAELDYQLYVAGNNPEEVTQFHDHNMSNAIDAAIKDPETQSFLAEGFWSSDDDILLRKELKNDIQNLLRYNRWPTWWPNIPQEFKYQPKRQWLLNQYELFINKRPKSKRMPIALYYKAILNEYSPNIPIFAQTEVLSFYSDYPHRETLPLWQKLCKEFSESPEALEARWRIAVHLAGQAEFEKATELCEMAEDMLADQLNLSEKTRMDASTFSTAFTAPAETAMTPFKLTELHAKLQKLKLLIGPRNRTDSDESKNRLARFVILNPYSSDYPQQLDRLLAEVKNKDPLRDNILLAKNLLIPDVRLKAARLNELSEKFAKTDCGIQALYELGMLKVSLWKDPQTTAEDKETYLTDARAILMNFIALYPESIFSTQAQAILDNLPSSQ
jgi:hypothetical protein